MIYEFKNNQLIFEKEFQPIELSVVLDNILNNSKKKSASKVIFDFKIENENLVLSIKDLGKTLDNSIAKELIFEEGVTSTKGAGLGLSHVKRILEKDFNATVEYNPNYTRGFELIIKFEK
jgi:signal transduction histidine kinase